MILAIETSTSVCSVAFENEDGKVFEKRTQSRGSHSEKLFLFIRELMEEHRFKMDDLEAVLVSEGPGSYTGLRIAASGVKGLLFGSGVPLYGVQTLASFGMCASLEIEPESSRIHAIIDARRVHVYHQLFDVSGGVLSTDKEAQVIPIESFEKMVHPNDIIIGTGLDRLDVNCIKETKQFGKDLISARSLVQVYHRKEAGPFIQEVAAESFDPKYYTSNQVK